MNLWPHQIRGISLSRECYQQNINPWCVVGACGSGKSLTMQSIADPVVEKGLKVVYLLHRRMLVRQFVKSFNDQGKDFGVVASDYPKLNNPKSPVQVVSVQTLIARRKKGLQGTVIDQVNAGFLPYADFVFLDEAHAQTSQSFKELIDAYVELGASVVGFTATPVGLGDIYKKLVDAGKPSEMLECNAHLPLKCYSGAVCDPDLFRPVAVGRMSEREVAKSFGFMDDGPTLKAKAIFGNVIEWWQKLNPNQLPAMLFAPGVKESMWFVQQFAEIGVRAAHIDATRILLTDENMQVHEYTRNEQRLTELLEGSKDGTYKVICNRFVMREAINCPWLYHCILATSMTKVSTYMQSAGRVQRYWPEYDHVILQDHGANINRFLRPDMDRDWELGDTNESVSKAIQKKREETKGDEAEMIRCPKCGYERAMGAKCPDCGHMHKRSIRLVFQHKGEFVEVGRHVGRTTKYHRPRTFDDIYHSALYGASRTGATVGQAFRIACARATERNVEIETPTRMKSYKPEDREWKLSVREVYPWIKPK